MRFNRQQLFIKKWLVTGCTTAVIVLQTAWSALAALTDPPHAIMMEDATGAQIEVRLPVKRLVVLTSDALEVVRSLNASDLVAGVYSGISKNKAFWPGLKDRPRVGSWKEINYEQVVALNPDAVLCYGARPGKDAEKKLAPFGIQVIRLDFFKPDSIEGEIILLGQILGREKDAKELATWHAKHLAHVRKVADSGSPAVRIYIEGDSNYRTAGPGSGGYEMCASAGGNNIASDLTIAYPEVTPEWVVTANPDVMVKVSTKRAGVSCYTMTDNQGFDAIRDSIMSRPAWGYINAVQQGRVHVIANEIWTGPRAVIGMYYLSKWLFPGNASDFDPMALHREYLERFQKIHYQGVYASPEWK